MNAKPLSLFGDQVKSRQRVASFGEVFTAEREVNAMLDLVKEQTERIEARFLEPACGDGNFLVEVLRRKLATVARKHGPSQHQYERNAMLALCSIYGVELLQDNVEACRERLLNTFIDHYTNQFPSGPTDELKRTAAFVLSRNILWGDALNLKEPNQTAKPIVFSEWSPVNGTMIKRRDFTLANLLQNQPLEGPNLFSDLGDHAFIPTPVADYPLTHYLSLPDAAANPV